MLRVFKASGEGVCTLPLAELCDAIGVCEQPVQAVDLKRHLQGLCGQPRFRQRLLLPDGQILSDDAVLTTPVDVQLILLPLAHSTEEQLHGLCNAVVQEDLPTLEQLLDRPQDPNCEMTGASPLSLAARHGRVAAARLLLEACADKDQANLEGNTALAMAAVFCQLEVVQLLLEATANINKANLHGQSPLFRAACVGEVEVVRMLLDAKADQEKATETGETPIFYASLLGDGKIIRLLLEARADTNKANSKGATPISVAFANHRWAVVDLLTDARSQGRSW